MLMHASLGIDGWATALGRIGGCLPQKEPYHGFEDDISFKTAWFCSLNIHLMTKGIRYKHYLVPRCQTKQFCPMAYFALMVAEETVIELQQYHYKLKGSIRTTRGWSPYGGKVWFWLIGEYLILWQTHLLTQPFHFYHWRVWKFTLPTAGCF